MDKITLRKTMILARKSLSSEERRAKSTVVCARILSWIDLQNISEQKITNVALYNAIHEELNLTELHQGLERRKILCCFPRIQGKTMIFAPPPLNILNNEEWVKGPKGILEPSENSPMVSWSLIDLFVVPGLAFETKNGARLGYGGGYYDRALREAHPAHNPIKSLTYLAQNPDVRNRYKAKIIGVGFDLQFIDHIPEESHDVRMDLLASETRLIQVQAS